MNQKNSLYVETGSSVSNIHQEIHSGESFSEYISNAKLPPATTANPFDYLNSKIGFFGRKRELELLNRFAKTDALKVWAITGPGGIGKSKLARKFATDNADTYKYVWIRKKEEYRKLLGFDNYKYEGKQIIFILDYAIGNEEQINDLIEKLIQNDVKSKILMLERSDMWYTNLSKSEYRYILETKYSDESLNLTDFETDKEAIKQLIHNYAEVKEKDITKDIEDKIINKLYDLSDNHNNREKIVRYLFVLLITDAYLNDTGHFEELNKEVLLNNYFKSSHFKGTEEEKKNAFRVLAYATAVGGIDTEEDNFPESVNSYFNKLAEDLGYEDAIQYINNISGSENNDIIYPMKPDLLGEFLFLDELKKENPSVRKDWIGNIIANEEGKHFLSRSIADWYEQSENIWKYIDSETLSNSILEIEDFEKSFKIVKYIKERITGENNELINLGDALYYTFQKGHKDARQKIIEYISEIQRKITIKDDEASAYLLNINGRLYQAQGDYSNAMVCYIKALDIREKVLGTEHPDTASTYNNIAGLYKAQGDYSKALEYYEKDLAISEKVLGTEHPDTAATYNNIALLYQDQGDYSKALEYYNKALAIKEKVLGTEHPSAATTYHNIAGLYKAQGDYSKALEYYNKALAIIEKVLGTEHPDTATTYNNIAGLYQDQGDYSKALEYYEKDLAISEKVLGTEHPSTAKTYNNIAGLYQDQGDYSKALEYYEKDLAISEKVLGTEHPDTATTYNNIAGLYKAQGDYSKALEYYNKALEIREKVLGTEHPSTAKTYNNIAGLYKAQGDYSKALEYHKKALDVKKEVLGENHPSTATSYNNIGSVYYAQKEYEKATEYINKTLIIFENILGPNHPNTKTIYGNLATLYMEMGDIKTSFEYAVKSGLFGSME